MKDFLIRLYQIENFVMYISITIAVLVVIFILVLFLGKKDQKLEQTRKLKKIDEAAFKENSSVKSVEATKSDNVVLVPEMPVVPITATQAINIEDVETVSLKSSNEAIVPETESIIPNRDNNISSIEAKLAEVSRNVEIKDDNVEVGLPELPIVEPVNVEIDKTIVNEDMVNQSENNVIEDNFSNNEVVSEMPAIDNSKQLINEDVVVELPKMKEEVNFESSYNDVSDDKKIVGAPVFSSVYAPPKTDEIIDLTHINKVKSDVNNNSSSFSNISGETYNIDR